MSEARNMSSEDERCKAFSPFHNIVVIGLGLIGASLAAALKKTYPNEAVFGVDTDSRSRVVAKDLNWVDEAYSPEDEALEELFRGKADLVILATPVSSVDEYLKALKKASYSGVLTDTLSSKAHILEAASSVLANPSNYIPGHPMTGSENSGIDAARSDLFKGTNWVLCPDENTDPQSFQKLYELILGLEARVVSVRPEDHDRAVAIVSHVPHIVASSLVNLAMQHADESQAIMRLAAGGFKDTTRIAAGSPNLWCGIAFDNSLALQEGLDEFIGILDKFSSALKDKDKASFTEMLDAAAKTRRALPVSWVPGSDKLLEVRIPMVNKSGVIAEVTTIASSVGCNIQSIEIDHISEGNAVLSLMLTDEGDIGQLSYQLINAGYSVSFNPISPREYAHVD